MSRARSNKENRPKRPSTLGLLLGGTGGRKDASKGAEAERQRRRRERDRSREMAAYVGYDAMYRDGIATTSRRTNATEKVATMSQSNEKPCSIAGNRVPGVAHGSGSFPLQSPHIR